MRLLALTAERMEKGVGELIAIEINGRREERRRRGEFGEHSVTVQQGVGAEIDPTVIGFADGAGAASARNDDVVDAVGIDAGGGYRDPVTGLDCPGLTRKTRTSTGPRVALATKSSSPSPSPSMSPTAISTPLRYAAPKGVER